MSKKGRAEIKHLETMKSDLEAKLSAVKHEKENIDREISTLNQGIKNIEKRMNEIKINGKIIVSEHAILRYIERVIGINIDEIAEKILPEEMEESIEILGNGTYSVNQCEFNIKVSDGVVVTVVKE